MLNRYRNNKPVRLVYLMDDKKKLMYYFGIGINIASTKLYMELDKTKLPQLAGITGCNDVHC